jgi:hypothetical protein
MSNTDTGSQVDQLGGTISAYQADWSRHMFGGEHDILFRSHLFQHLVFLFIPSHNHFDSRDTEMPAYLQELYMSGGALFIMPKEIPQSLGKIRVRQETPPCRGGKFFQAVFSRQRQLSFPRTPFYIQKSFAINKAVPFRFCLR